MLSYFLEIRDCSTQTNICSQKCIDLPGRYECRCNTGYTLSTADMRTCNGKSELSNTSMACRRHGNRNTWKITIQFPNFRAQFSLITCDHWLRNFLSTQEHKLIFFLTHEHVYVLKYCFHNSVQYNIEFMSLFSFQGTTYKKKG